MTTKNRVKPYCVILRAEIKKGNRMQQLIEYEIPAASMEEAEKLRKPFYNQIVRAIKSMPHRRRKLS